MTQNTQRHPSIFIGYIMALVTCIISTEVYIPCLTVMKDYFATTEGALRSTISCAFLGSFFSSLFAGLMIDYWGKRRLFVASMLIFILSGALSPFAPGISFLWIMRFFQGTAIGLLPVLIVAHFSEVYIGRELTRIMSYVGVAITLSLSASPFIGGWIGEYVGWQGCFFLPSLIQCGILAFVWRGLRTLSKNAEPYSFEKAKRDLRNMGKSRNFLMYLMIGAFAFGATILLRTSLSQYLGEQFSFSPSKTGNYLALGMLVNTLVGLGVGGVARRISEEAIMMTGIILLAFCGVGYVFVGYFLPLNIVAIMGVYLVLNAATPMHLNTSVPLALSQPTISKTMGTSIFFSVRSFVTSMAIYSSTLIYNGTLSRIALFFCTLCFVCVVCLFFIQKVHPMIAEVKSKEENPLGETAVDQPPKSVQNGG